MLLTAASYGVMSRIYPVAGSAYSYTRKSLDAYIGFLVGWAILLDYLFLPMVIWLIGTAYLASAFPAVPAWAWVPAFIILTTAINVRGVAVAEKINLALMILQFGVLGLFVVMPRAIVIIALAGGAILCGTVHPAPGRGRRHSDRQDHDAGIRLFQFHAQPALGHHPQSLEP